MLRPHGGQRRFQLVGGIEEKIPLPLERILQPVQHPVDGSCQLAELVLPVSGRDSSIKVFFADILCQILHPPDRPQNLAGHKTADGDQGEGGKNQTGENTENQFPYFFL